MAINSQPKSQHTTKATTSWHDPLVHDPYDSLVNLFFHLFLIDGYYTLRNTAGSKTVLTYMQCTLEDPKVASLIQML